MPIDPTMVVKSVTAEYVKRNIDIPKIVLTPAGEVTSGYRDFDLDVRAIRLQPVATDILVHHLQSNERERLETGAGFVPEQRSEDYIVRCLIDFDGVSYDDHADLLYKLAGQAVTHLRSYLGSEEEVVNVLQFHQKTLANLIHAQMEQHHHEAATEFVVTVTRGFIHLEGADFTLPAGETIRDFRVAPEAARDISGLLFGKFAKCTYFAQRFNSTPEWRFAGILESDPDVLKWVKPTPSRFQIFYRGDHSYEPDFVVETRTEKLLCEVKTTRDMEDAEVREKSLAAVQWCRHATDHERRHGGKPWHYVLIPLDAIEANRTLAGLAARFAVTSP